MTRREMWEWVRYIEREERDVESKQDNYLAQIAYEVYKLKFALGGKPSRKFADFILKWKQEESQTAKEKTPEQRRQERKDRLAVSKAYWGGISGRREKRRAELKKRAHEERLKRLEARKKNADSGHNRSGIENGREQV